MVFLGKYDELAPGMGFPSMKDSFYEKPYPAKESVLNYLKSGKIHMVTAARMVDVFTGKITNLQNVHMNDGKYSWSSSLIHYIDKYNLRLPEEVETDILKK